MDDVARRGLIGHGEIGRERPERRVRAGQQRIVLGVRDGTGPRLTHAVHLDLRELHELADEEVDVDAGAPVDVGWVLAGEDADAHRAIVDVDATGARR